MKSIFVVFLILWGCMLHAQTEIISEVVKPVDSIRPASGANGKHHLSSFVGFHFVIPIPGDDLAPVLPGVSNGWRIGWMSRYRFTGMLSGGYMLDFNTLSYRYEQTDLKTFPDTFFHDDQSMGIASFGTGLFMRLNFDPKRGNVLGRYIDAGGYVDWNFSRYVRTRDHNDLDEVVKVRTSRLTFAERYQYGVYGAIGIGKFNIYARYRLSDLIKPPYSSAETPRLHVGFGFAF